MISPKNILVEFLRNRLTDPRSRAEATYTETFDGGGTEFSLSPPTGTLGCVIAVTVTAVDQQKWKKYYIDWQNEKVIFYSATAAGVGNVSITYKYGTTNWIYPDKAKVTLSATSFPRINVLVVSGTGERLGQYNSDMETAFRFQIDIWAKEDQAFTISGIVYEGDKLAEKIGYDITKAFRANEADLFPELYNYGLLSTPADIGFNREYECFHKVIDVELKAINASEGQ